MRESTSSRHTFSLNAPSRRSTLNVFDSAAAEEAGIETTVKAPSKRSSMTAIDVRREDQFGMHQL